MYIDWLYYIWVPTFCTLTGDISSNVTNQCTMLVHIIYYISSSTDVYLVSLPVHGCFGLPDDEEDPKKPEID